MSKIINLENYSFTDFPTALEGNGAVCYNGTKGTVEAFDASATYVRKSRIARVIVRAISKNI